jgi:hypothetical protein
VLIVTAPVTTSAATTNERTTELSVTRFDPIYYLVDATPLRLHRLPRPIGVTHSALAACVVLDIDDQPVTQAQEMRPLVPGAIAFGPGDDDRAVAVPLLDPINPQVAVPVPVAPLDR